MNHSVILLVLNGYLSVLSCCALLIFGHYLVKNYREGYVQMRPAIALFALWLGESVFRVPIFLTRARVESGHLINVPILPLLVGGFITITALLCIIRVFSPIQWGNKSWVSALILSTFVVGITLNTVL